MSKKTFLLCWQRYPVIGGGVQPSLDHSGVPAKSSRRRPLARGVITVDQRFGPHACRTRRTIRSRTLLGPAGDSLQGSDPPNLRGRVQTPGGRVVEALAGMLAVAVSAVAAGQRSASAIA
jgi:hypothetical protein